MGIKKEYRCTSTFVVLPLFLIYIFQVFATEAGIGTQSFEDVLCNRKEDQMMSLVSILILSSMLSMALIKQALWKYFRSLAVTVFSRILPV